MVWVSCGLWRLSLAGASRTGLVRQLPQSVEGVLSPALLSGLELPTCRRVGLAGA